MKYLQDMRTRPRCTCCKINRHSNRHFMFGCHLTGVSAGQPLVQLQYRAGHVEHCPLRHCWRVADWDGHAAKLGFRNFSTRIWRRWRLLSSWNLDCEGAGAGGRLCIGKAHQATLDKHDESCQVLHGSGVWCLASAHHLHKTEMVWDVCS